MTIVLDTHVWIWLLTGDENKIDSHLRAEIERSAHKNDVYISAISIWETAMLVSKGRLQLKEPLNTWIDKALGAPGINWYPLTPQVSCESVQLPGDFHGDPADRMVVATTRILHGSLVTKDREIIDYARKGYMDILSTQKK